MNDADRDFLANQKLEEALKLYYAKDYQSAIKIYNKVLKFGEYPVAYYNRGICYQKLGDNAKAQANFAKAKELGI